MRGERTATPGMGKGLLVLVSLAAAKLLGCNEDGTSLVARHVGVPDERTCIFEPDPSGTFRNRGLLDVALSPVYLAHVLLANQLTPRGDKENLRTETSNIILEGAVVELEDTAGALLIEFTVPTSGFIEASAGETSGFGGALVTLIPEEHGSQLSRELGTGDAVTRIAKLRVFGHTVGGHSVESTELAFPILVCSGCTVDYSPATQVVGTGAWECVATEGGDLGEAPCLAGQDEITDCRHCFAEGTCTPPRSSAE